MKEFIEKVRSFRDSSIKKLEDYQHNILKPRIKKTLSVVEKRPVTSFLASLFVLIVLIVLGSLIGRPPQEKQVEKLVKTVSTFGIGQTPRIQLQAKIVKSGVLTIVAQTGGIVNKIHVKEGSSIQKGSKIVSLSSNYQGGNAASLQAAIASAQYKNFQETFDAQKDLIQKQREAAEKTDSNSDEIRSISQKSVDETKSLLSLNDQIISSLDATISSLEATNVGGQNDATLLQTRSQKSQFLGATNQIRSTFRNLEHQTNSEKPVNILSDLQKDIAVKQLDLQEKTLDLNKEISSLSQSLAFLNASLMHPVSPMKAAVERIYVRVGQSIQPGSPIALLSGSGSLQAIVSLPAGLSQVTSRIQVSTLYINSKTFRAVPTFISSQATDGELYTLVYDIPAEFESDLTDDSFISIEIPVENSKGLTRKMFIPIDSIYQTQEDEFVYVVKNNKAIFRKITMGQVLGSYVEVTSGLSDKDEVILDRDITSDEDVRTSN